MIPTIEEIEYAIMSCPKFNFRQNLMVFRASDFSSVVYKNMTRRLIKKENPI